MTNQKWKLENEIADKSLLAYLESGRFVIRTEAPTMGPL